MVTSWNWLYLADFASFKPTYIPDDDPSDFSFFFDTGGRRRCYLAPEVSSFHFVYICMVKIMDEGLEEATVHSLYVGCVELQGE